MSEPADALTLLIVEDDSAVRETIELMCGLWGYGVMSFSNGFQAQEWLDNRDLAPPLPDLGLLDIRMPGPQGHEIAAMIRKHPQLENMGIVLMTAYELPFSDHQEVLTVSGADRLLYKPLPGMKQLQAIIEEVLADRRNRERADSQAGN